VEASPGLAIRANRKYNKEIGHEWCPHKDDERGFVSTTCSVELELALKKGYRVTKVYSIYHWEQWSDTLLRPYVQDMMCLKIEVLNIFIFINFY